MEFATICSKAAAQGRSKRAAPKSIPQKRLKIPGASWHADSIDPLQSLRILRADDWWDDFWNQRTEKLMAA